MNRFENNRVGAQVAGYGIQPPPVVPVPADGDYLVHVDAENVATIPPGVTARLRWNKDGTLSMEMSRPDGGARGGSRYGTATWSNPHA